MKVFHFVFSSHNPNHHMENNFLRVRKLGQVMHSKILLGDTHLSTWREPHMSHMSFNNQDFVMPIC